MQFKMICMTISSTVWAMLFVMERYSRLKKLDIGIILGIGGIISNSIVILNNL